MKNSKLLFIITLMALLLSGCTKEAWQEMYLSDILGTWSGYTEYTNHHLVDTFNSDKTFSYNKDNEPTVKGTYKYVSVGGMITLKPEHGDEEKWFIMNREEYSMKLIINLISYNMTRSGNYH